MSVPRAKKVSPASASVARTGARITAPGGTTNLSSAVRRWRRSCASAVSRAAVANAPVANAPVANAPVANAPVANANVANANVSSAKAARLPRTRPDWVFLLMLAPLAVASLPSMLFCLLQLALWTHGVLSAGPMEFHLPARTVWDALFALQANAFAWVARWNSVATLLATGLFVATLVRPRWRDWSGLSLLPFAVLLCADFTLRLHPVLLP